MERVGKNDWKKDKLATAARDERGWSREKGSVKMGTPTVKKRTSAIKKGGAYNGILQWRQWRKASLTRLYRVNVTANIDYCS